MINKLNKWDLNCSVFNSYDFDDCMSLNELLCRFFTKINECIEASNKSLNLLEWLHEVGLKEEVVTLLGQWKDDGTLTELISEQILAEIKQNIANNQSAIGELQSKDTELEGTISSLRGDIETNNGNIEEVKSELKTLSEQLDNKTNLNNNKVVIENSKNDTSPALNVYNKNMQGTFPLGGTNAGIVLHNYTDAPAMQIDNVGVNSALVINLANNPNNRPDKDPNFCGNGNFISTFQTYFDGSEKKIKKPFRINNLAEFEYADGYNSFIRIKSDDNNSESCLTMLCEKPHKKTFSLINSSLKYYNHTNNTEDYSYNYNSTRHNIFNFNSTGQAVFNNGVTTGYSYVFNGNSSDGTIFKINGNNVFQIMEYSTFANAISLKPITNDTTIPINTLFMDGEGNLKFKNFNGEVKTINLT